MHVRDRGDRQSSGSPADVVAVDQSLSQQLAGFARRLSAEQLPTDVREHVKLLVLDVAGLCLVARDEDFARAIMDVVTEMGGVPESRPLGLDAPMPAASAALVGGTLTHGHDFDDSHVGSTIHTTSSVVPAALALAEVQRSSGVEVLVTIAAGLEVNARIGLGAGDGFHRRGFHPTGVCGALAASQVAGRLLGLDAARMAQAMGISGSMASGLREAYLGGETWAKRLHPGWAAHAGIIAARLARRDFSGPLRVLDGRFGLYNAMLGPGNWDSQRVVAGLGQEWEIRRIGFKPYPCGVVIHPYLDALHGLMDEHRLAGSDLAAIHCRVAPGALETVCEPVDEKLHPTSGYQGKFSLQFCLASLAIDGEVGLDTFRPEAAHDNRVLELADRVTYEADSSLPYPRAHAAVVMVTTRDGQQFTRAETANRGSLENPMSAEDVRRKFRANAARVLDPAGIDALENEIMQLEHLPEARTVVDCAASTPTLRRTS
ncbi:MAG: MmgE/PrpD family protein [Chloroflexi bacterium]|nr:MmgE/PrpD family protein [Chloroflexota bacterium]